MNAEAQPRAQASGQSSERLTPLILPSGTTLRLAVLAAATFAAGAVIYGYVYPVASFSRNHFDAATTMLRCVDATGLGTKPLSAQVINSAEACRATYGRADARYILLALGCLFGLALLIYAARPHWTTRRGRLMPITGDTMPEPAAFLEDLVRETAVAPAPTFLLDPSRWTTGGHVFGHRRHPRIQLDAGLIAMVKTNPRTVRAVVLHELAHIRARDLTATYLAVAIWQAFVAAALVPLALFTVYPGALIAPTRWTWSGLDNLVRPSTVLEETTMLALAALVYLTRNGVLRARETYADAIAAQWDANDAAAALLEAVARVRRRRGPAWQYLLRKHPDPRRRQAVMLDPDAAFRVGPWDMAGVGTALAVAADGACYLAEQAFPGNELAAWSAIGAVLALIVSATVSAALWRPTLRSTIRGLPLPRVGHLALALTAGYLLGDCLRINTFGTGGSLPQLGEPALDDAVGILLLFTALTLFAAWTTRTAAVWISAARGRSLRWALAGSTLAGWAVLAPFFAFWLPVHLIPGLAQIQWATSALAESEGWYYWHGWGISVFRAQYSPVTYWTANPLAMPCLALVVLVPFLAGVRRRYRRAGAGAETAPTWRLRAQPDAGAYPPLTRAVLRPGSALSTGFVGGVVVVVLNLILQVVVRYAVPEATQHDDGFIYYLQYAEFAGMVLAQSAVAARTALRSSSLRIIHGLLAASVTGLMCTAAWVAGKVTTSCVGVSDFNQGWDCGFFHPASQVAGYAQKLLVEGFIASIIGAVVAIGIADAARYGRTRFIGNQGSISVVAIEVDAEVLESARSRRWPDACLAIAWVAILGCEVVVTVLNTPRQWLP